MEPAILVVDDEPSICDSLAAFLEDEGMVVHIAHTGEEALTQVSDGLAIDACVMDLRLPGINGADAILAMRRIAPQIRFVIHTGSLQDSVVTRLHGNGLDDVPVFRKPVGDLGELARVLTDLCQAD